MELSRTEARDVRAVAHRLGVEVRHPGPDAPGRLLQMAYDHAIAGAALARSERERDAYMASAIKARLALSGGN